MVGAYVELVKVLEEERPLRGVQLGGRLLGGFHSEALLLLRNIKNVIDINYRLLQDCSKSRIQNLNTLTQQL